ncbi:MAG: LCP family protein, partial [bacterium]
MTKAVSILLLSLTVLGASPGRLATGCLFVPNCVPEPLGCRRVTGAPVDSYSPLTSSIRPESNFRPVYSDIRGDLKCGRGNVPYVYRDNGIRRHARELGYTNRLLGLGCGGERGTNILLLGIDRRGKRGRGRSDTIILLRIVPDLGVLTLSIPRDIKVPTRPGRRSGYQDKIAHMYLYGGVERTRAAVESLLRVKIDHYLVVESLAHFKALLSLIRGVDIDKHLEGRLGLKWIRNRTFARGDFERVMRTQVFVKAAIAKAWSLTDGGDERLANILARTSLLFVSTDL